MWRGGWARAARPRCGPRYNEWNAHGAFDALVAEAIGGYDRIVGVDLSDASVDASLHKAPCGGGGTGKSPVDRGKSGWKWSLLCDDRAGIPVSWAADGANRNDQTLLGPTLAAAQQRGLLCDVETLHLDRGYAGDPVLKLCESYGIHDVVRAPKRARGHRPPKAQDRPAGDALDHRAHQLMAIELRATTAQHRPQHHRTPRTTRTRRRADHHRQTLQMGRPMEPHLTAYLRSLLVVVAATGAVPGLLRGHERLGGLGRVLVPRVGPVAGRDGLQSGPAASFDAPAPRPRRAFVAR